MPQGEGDEAQESEIRVLSDIASTMKHYQNRKRSNSKTLMFVNISPADYNYQETKSSLYFGSKFVTGQSQDQIMKNLLNMSDSDEEEEAADRKIKKLKKQTKKDDEESEGDSDEEEPAIVNRGKKIQKDSEDIRKDREKERKRREDNE